MRSRLWLTCLLSCIFLLGFNQLQYVSNDSASFTKLIFVGDISLNHKMIEDAYDETTQQHNFNDLFYYIKPILNLGDIVVGNFENTLGEAPYGRYPTYNVPEAFGVALKYAGFNLLMTANAKAVHQELDEWTISKNTLASIGIDQTGSFESEDDLYRRNPTMVDKNGIKTAYINYMAGIDFVPEVSPLVNAAVATNITRDILTAKNRGAEFVVVYLNWGKEYQSFANVSQQELANYCHEAGANLVLGSHPHIVQEFASAQQEMNGQIVPVLTAYSLGDFFNRTQSLEVNGAYILEVILCKENASGITKVCDYGYIPTYTYEYMKDGKMTYSILPVSQIENGNISADMPLLEFEKMHQSAQRVRFKMGHATSEVIYELSDEIVADVDEVLEVTSRPLNESREFKLNAEEVLLASSGFMDESNELTIPNKKDGLVYKVQFLTLKQNLNVDTRYYTHLEGYEVVYEEGYYKYLIGSEGNLKSANDLCLDVKRLGHSKAFVVVYKNGKRLKL